MNEKIDDTLAKKKMRARKVDSHDSTFSAETEISQSPKDVLALGQVIVRQLDLQDRGTVLERWTAHHLAEVIAEANHTVGPTKAASEAQAVDLILKLWAHRRALPEPIDPLGGYRRAVEVLSRLAPDANPWAYYRGPGTYDDLLREMFQLLSTVVLAGVLLTRTSRVRPIAEEESKALEEEERHLHSTLEQWMSFVARSPPKPEIKIEFADTGTTEGAEADRESEGGGDSSRQDRTSDEQVIPDDASLHAVIVSNLERMQTDLADLLTRWRGSSPGEREGENSVGSVGGCAATLDGSLDNLEAEK